MRLNGTVHKIKYIYLLGEGYFTKTIVDVLFTTGGKINWISVSIVILCLYAICVMPHQRNGVKNAEYNTLISLTPKRQNITSYLSSASGLLIIQKRKLFCSIQCCISCSAELKQYCLKTYMNIKKWNQSGFYIFFLFIHWIFWFHKLSLLWFQGTGTINP